MIIEQVLSNTRVRHYSDQNMMIRQIETGNLYQDAVDNIPCIYTYEETDKPIPSDETEAEAYDYESALNEIGVNV